MWKTKETEVKGRKVISMICQNSVLEKSKWAEFAPEDKVCENWSIVDTKATASLCSQCVQRSVNIRISNK